MKSTPLPLSHVTVTDDFWRAEQELVRTAVIPYQWKALNDQVPGAAPSYAMHNFKAAAAQNERKHDQGTSYVPPTYTFRGFESLPKDPQHPDSDKFYGFVFQDSDFSKWIEAVGYSLAQHPDPQLEATADEAIDIVCKAQLDNGYLDTYYILNGMDRAFTNLKDHHELYCFGHLTEGAITYYEGTGKDKLLHAACRFADYIDSVFGTDEGKLHGYPGHEIAEMALVRLAEVTGQQRYADLAEYFIRQRGQQPLYFEEEDRQRAQAEGQDFQPREQDYAYYQAHEPVTEQSEAVGHAVRATYLYSGLADVARLTGDAELTQAAHRLWRNIVDKKLYVTGGIGGTSLGEAFSFDYDLPNDTIYSETCAAVALVFFARRMLELEPVAEYADVMESALYNTVLAGMAMDGKSFFYVNPLEVVPEACHKDVRKAHVKPVRQKWFGCACCPPNIARLVESVQEYAYTRSDDGNTLFTHLYIAGSTQVELGGTPMTIDMNSSLPWQGAGEAVVHVGTGNATGKISQSPMPLAVSVVPEGEHDLSDATTATSDDVTLAFRLPAWAGGECASDSITTTGESTQSGAGRIRRSIHDGYVYFTGEWRDGDTVSFDFPMPVRIFAANSMVREDADKVAFVRGPITYCAEERDNGSNLHLLHVDADAIVAEPDLAKASEYDFHAGAAGMNSSGLGEVDSVTRHMVKLEVPAWRSVLPQDYNQSDGKGDSAEHQATSGDGFPIADGTAAPCAGSPEHRPLYASYTPPQRSDTTATLIPYFAWANRGENEMIVWLNR